MTVLYCVVYVAAGMDTDTRRWDLREKGSYAILPVTSTIILYRNQNGTKKGSDFGQNGPKSEGLEAVSIVRGCGGAKAARGSSSHPTVVGRRCKIGDNL